MPEWIWIVVAVLAGWLLVWAALRSRRSNTESVGAPTQVFTPNRIPDRQIPPSSDFQVRPELDADAPPNLVQLLGSLRDIGKALADGEMNEEEIQRLFPGATVKRQDSVIQIGHPEGGIADWGSGGDQHHVEWAGPVSSTTSINIDGQTVHSVDEIPDPEVREKVRRILDAL